VYSVELSEPLVDIVWSQDLIYAVCRSSDCGMKNKSNLSLKSNDVQKLFNQYVLNKKFQLMIAFCVSYYLSYASNCTYILPLWML